MIRRPLAGRKRPISRFRRGAYLLPSLLTTANIFCGFTSIVMTFQGDFRPAAMLIIAAGILDGLDGRIARMTGSTSAFGGEYDSLADVVSFGLAPAFLVHVWGLAPLRRYGWVLAFLFLVCGAIRLARFNIQHGASDRRWFVGLPIPMAAAAVAGCVLSLEEPIRDRRVSALFGVAVLALSLLMVSRIRYRSFKDIDLRSRRPFRSVVPIAVAIAAFALYPLYAIFAIASVYLLSGPLAPLVSARGTRRGAAAGDEAGAQGVETREAGRGGADETRADGQRAGAPPGDMHAAGGEAERRAAGGKSEPLGEAPFDVR